MKKPIAYYYHELLIRPTTSTFHLLIRYFLAAGGAFVFDYSTYVLSAYWFQMPYMLAAIISFVVGTCYNYIFSKWIVFVGHPKSRIGELAAVFLINGSGLLLLEIGLYILTEWMGLHYLYSKLVMSLLVCCWNFFVRKFFLYSSFFNILKD